MEMDQQEQAQEHEHEHEHEQHRIIIAQNWLKQVLTRPTHPHVPYLLALAVVLDVFLGILIIWNVQCMDIVVFVYAYLHCWSCECVYCC